MEDSYIYVIVIYIFVSGYIIIVVNSMRLLGSPRKGFSISWIVIMIVIAMIIGGLDLWTGRFTKEGLLRLPG